MSSRRNCFNCNSFNSTAAATPSDPAWIFSTNFRNSPCISWNFGDFSYFHNKLRWAVFHRRNSFNYGSHGSIIIARNRQFAKYYLVMYFYGNNRNEYNSFWVKKHISFWSIFWWRSYTTLRVISFSDAIFLWLFSLTNCARLRRWFYHSIVTSDAVRISRSLSNQNIADFNRTCRFFQLDDTTF